MLFRVLSGFLCVRFSLLFPFFCNQKERENLEGKSDEKRTKKNQKEKQKKKQQKKSNFININWHTYVSKKGMPCLFRFMKSKLYHYSFQIPETVSLEKNENWVKFSGPLGQSFLNLHKIDPQGLGGISFNRETHSLEILSPSKSFFGLFKKLIENKIIGVTRGFLLYLKIMGIGYRASLNHDILLLKLGFSHDIFYRIPSSIKLFLVDPTVICLFGVDKNQITQIAAKIRGFRPPSAYKGKGIRAIHENIGLKQGKKK